MKKEYYRGRPAVVDRNRPTHAYIYLVRNPNSNEMCVCAWDSVLYAGTSVVAPTRYGLDLGVVVSSADGIGKEYHGGSTQCHGACSSEQCTQAHGAGNDRGQVETFGDDGLVVWNSEPDELPCAVCPGCAGSQEAEMVAVSPHTVWIERLATPGDMKRYQEFSAQEDDALRICREKIAAHRLEMKLVTAHFLLGEPKIVFFFTADVRVDFRSLVKDLVSVFRIRIELRQIGVRDESRVLGGLAVCGRDFCCHSVTDKLKPVSIKMAKEQNLSLNSMKISGPCGRLLCCLSYEFDFYAEEKKQYPPEGSRLRIGHELLKVSEVNILSKNMTLTGPEGRMLVVPCSAAAFDEDGNRWEIRKEYEDEFLSN